MDEQVPEARSYLGARFFAAFAPEKNQEALTRAKDTDQP
jgi:hypothetical protein